MICFRFEQALIEVSIFGSTVAVYQDGHGRVMTGKWDGQTFTPDYDEWLNGLLADAVEKVLADTDAYDEVV